MIKPLQSKVLIKRILEESKKGLIITTSSPVDNFIGTIEAIGSCCSENISVGDQVLYEKYQGSLYEDCYLLIDEKHLLAVLE